MDNEIAHGTTYAGRKFTFKDGVFKIIDENDELMPVTAEVGVDIRFKASLDPRTIATKTD